MSLEMSPFDRAQDFLLTFYSNYGQWLRKWGQGPDPSKIARGQLCIWFMSKINTVQQSSLTLAM